MQIRYFVVDDAGQLRKTSRKAVERLWKGRGTSDQLGIEVADEFRLVSAVCDENLIPKMCFFLRTELDDGRITEDSRIDAYEAVGHPAKRRYDHPAAQRQFAGWPRDWQHQLAVALDVPASQLRKIGIGGPLLMSDLWGISIEKVLEYFEFADSE